MVSIKNIKETSLVPDIGDKEIKKLLPTRIKPYLYEFELHDINTSIANGLRRTMATEIPVLRMNFEYKSLIKTDPYVLVDLILSRILCIPIDQSIPIDAEFELFAENTTSYTRDVKTKEIKWKGKSKELPFNETFTICTLEPGTSIRISSITIKRDYGYIFGGYCIVSNAVSLPLDVEPANNYTRTGVSTSIANPTKFLIRFNSNGDMAPNKIIGLACDTIIQRIQNLEHAPIVPELDYHKIVVVGESDTLGCLFTRMTLLLYPKISMVTYKVAPHERLLTIRIRSDDDINDIINNVIKESVKIFDTIRKHF